MDGRSRSDICQGMLVDIVLKRDQPTGRLTRGVVRDILTKSPYHPHGIKVRLDMPDLPDPDRVGRVQHIVNS